MDSGIASPIASPIAVSVTALPSTEAKTNMYDLQTYVNYLCNRYGHLSDKDFDSTITIEEFNNLDKLFKLHEQTVNKYIRGSYGGTQV